MILMATPKERIPPRRLRCRWKHNIKMDLKTIGYDDIDWIDLV
jgi:hypothetical protein